MKDPSTDDVIQIWINVSKYADVLARDDFLVSIVVEFPAAGEVYGKDALRFAWWAADESPTLEEIRSSQNNRFNKLGKDNRQT